MDELFQDVSEQLRHGGFGAPPKPPALRAPAEPGRFASAE
jgi:hypothetical protein